MFFFSVPYALLNYSLIVMKLVGIFHLPGKVSEGGVSWWSVMSAIFMNCVLLAFYGDKRKIIDPFIVLRTNLYFKFSNYYCSRAQVTY